MPILRIVRLRPREVKSLIQVHADGGWLVNPDTRAPGSVLHSRAGACFIIARISQTRERRFKKLGLRSSKVTTWALRGDSGKRTRTPKQVD